ncbi:hypothetical protein AC482_05600 [miscellaneous Crenarchaeota group-15 archaeon DG-45]|uniref:Metallo-beta-lactamase domain-containing protein n=1 Tax=miscellaneous Crenarchaeota group-15 archaeon DG-45 TaxID=1685127 RepID=A0A0M0BMI1_9ARCH|nr:MAG: hypothetical protein AC482_05600 [miscellaneous Crenarchaeota group-15 archaeon DG-45]
MIIRWLGHASFLIRARGQRIYIDPYAGEYPEKGDVVLVTHGHGDHCDLEKLSKARRPGTLVLTSGPCAEGIPPDNVTAMAPGDRVDIDGVAVHAVEAYNVSRFRSPGVPYHPEGTQVGFVVEAEGRRVYHAGDTDYLPSMSALRGITLALLPIMGRATMDVDEAVEATLAIRPEMAMPMHLRDADPEEFKRKVEGRSDIKVVIMREGEELAI